MKAKITSRFDAIGVSPNCHIRRDKHSMPGVIAEPWRWPIHICPRLAVAAGLFEQDGDCHLFRGYVVPHSTGIEMLENVTNCDFVPAPRSVLDLVDSMW